MVEIKAKIQKIGNSYFVRVPKQLVDYKIIDLTKELTIQVDVGSKGLFYILAIIRYNLNKLFLNLKYKLIRGVSENI